MVKVIEKYRSYGMTFTLIVIGDTGREYKNKRISS